MSQEAVRTKCAMCEREMVDDSGGKYVPLCSEECEAAYNLPVVEERRDFRASPAGDESYWE